jgi:hypothetical protein
MRQPVEQEVENRTRLASGPGGVKRFLGMVLMVAASAAALSAHPILFPCNEISRSSNGRFVVARSVRLQPESGRQGRRIQQITLRVLPNNERFVHPPNLLTAPATDPVDSRPWRVVLDAADALRGWGCGMTLVTNDGKYMLILNTTLWVEPQLGVLRIYRRHRPGVHARDVNDGILVRTITLKEIWPADRFAVAETLWWENGQFDLSTDSRTLIHITRWGNIVRINLRNGLVHNLGASEAPRRH